MLLPCCSYIAWPICRLQSEIRGAFIPIFMNNLKVILCWSYGAAASRNGPSFPLVVIASFLLHCIRTTLSRAGFETWFGWKWSFEFSPSYFSARSAPCSHSQHSHRLGSFGTRRRWDHWVRATPFCKGQTVSAQCPRVQGKHWAELAEQGPCYGSSTGPTAALTHTLPSGFTPMRGSLHLCRPRLKMQPLPQHGDCAYGRQQAWGTGHCHSVQQTPWSLLNAGPVVGQSWDIPAGGSGYLGCFLWLSFACACHSPGFALCRIKHRKDFFSSQSGFCVWLCDCNCSTELKYWTVVFNYMKTIYISKYLTPVN